MSEDVRRLEVALAREGRDPKDYAEEILRRQPERFLVMVQRDRGEENEAPPSEGARKVSLVPKDRMRWGPPMDYWGIPVFTLEQWLTTAWVPDRISGIYDLKEKKPLFSGDLEATLEEGWRRVVGGYYYGGYYYAEGGGASGGGAGLVVRAAPITPSS